MTKQHNPNQTPPPPPYTRHITTHDANGLATIHSTVQPPFNPIDNDSMRFSVPFTTAQFPADLNDDADIRAYEGMVAKGTMGLVSPSGTVCRVVDFAPAKAGTKGLMHRTQSLDFGVVLEGRIEMWLDSGEMRVLEKGDIAVQRGTMHEWRNTSETEWVRMMFVLQGCREVEVGGKVVGEDLGSETEIRASRG
ncbi:hypothetical protein BDV25DRAFT_171919 [Aspergillus avenaceus]|uniref:Cupin type-2 domain-containing protein n=1 Tax=Aspergillus avenaceus TaxID=36643 RepID=A0A5N6TWP3_ASPAV|nr:hypothetical protein BDV25DRAFT_171919 [Aspergillus avenaceus]